MRGHIRCGVAVLIAVGASLFLGACVKRTLGPELGNSQMAPGLVVEAFLRAANTQDLQTMAALFGTRDGPITKRDPAENVERRMFLLAQLLKHDDYALDAQGIEPGRMGEAVRITVRLRRSGQEQNIPFTVVQTKGDKWLVEQIGLEQQAD